MELVCPPRLGPVRQRMADIAARLRRQSKAAYLESEMQQIRATIDSPFRLLRENPNRLGALGRPLPPVSRSAASDCVQSVVDKDAWRQLRSLLSAASRKRPARKR